MGTGFNSARLTDEGLTGFYDNGNAFINLDEFNEFLIEIEKKIKFTKELGFLLEKYGENILVAWKKDFDNLRQCLNKISSAKKYEENPQIQGNYYRECYNNLQKTLKECEFYTKRFSNIPKRVLKHFIEAEEG